MKTKQQKPIPTVQIEERERPRCHWVWLCCIGGCHGSAHNGEIESIHLDQRDKNQSQHLSGLASCCHQPYCRQQPTSASLSNSDQTNLSLFPSLTKIKPRSKNLRKKKFRSTKREIPKPILALRKEMFSILLSCGISLLE